MVTIRVLLDHGCKELINTPDTLGNTPLHALIVRYALEEARYGCDKWNKWDILHLVRYLIQSGARQSINQTGNSALACVLRHVRDWDICYELLNMLLNEGGKCNTQYLCFVQDRIISLDIFIVTCKKNGIHWHYLISNRILIFLNII